MKIKKLKELAINTISFVKKYRVYKSNLDRYLSMRDITTEDFLLIKKELFLDLSPSFLEEDSLKEGKEIFINYLIIESFYNNHELFKLFSNELSIENLIPIFYRRVFSNTNNDVVKTFQKEDLEKNLKIYDDENLKVKVLEKALNTGNVELLELIKLHLDFTPENSLVIKSMLQAVMNNGKNLKNTPTGTIIKGFLGSKDFSDILTGNLFLTDDREKNLNIFFNINLLELINQNKLDIKLDFLPTDKINKILKGINKNQDYSHKVLNYIQLNYPHIDILEKLDFLKKENLLTKELWEKIIKNGSRDLIGVLFKQKDKLNLFIDNKNIKNIHEKMKNYILESYYDSEKMNEFIEYYPSVLTEEEILKIIQKFSYAPTYTDNYSEINDANNFTILLDKLFKKYPHIIKDSQFFLKVMKNHINPDFSIIYLKKYCEVVEFSKELWINLDKKENNQLIENIFNNQKLVKKVISQEHLDHIIDLYKDYIFETYPNEEKLVNFIKKYPKNLTKDYLTRIIRSSYRVDTYSSNLEIEAREIITNAHYSDITIPAIFEKEDIGHSRDKMRANEELVEILYEKYGDLVNDLSIIECSHNDRFMYHFLNKYFELNTDQELKKEILQKLQIFEYNNNSNVIQWVIDNNLVNELINPKNNSNSIFSVTNKELNLWIPLFIENYNLNEEKVILKIIKEDNNNPELFKFILNNYPLSYQTQQELCLGVFKYNAIDLAKDLFAKGIFPDENNFNEFQSLYDQNESGNILMKSKLKAQLENKVQILENENIAIPKKIKKI